MKKPHKCSLLGRPVKFPAYQTFLIFYGGSIFYKEDKNLGHLHLNKQSFFHKKTRPRLMNQNSRHKTSKRRKLKPSRAKLPSKFWKHNQIPIKHRRRPSCLLKSCQNGARQTSCTPNHCHRMERWLSRYTTWKNAPVIALAQTWEWRRI